MRIGGTVVGECVFQQVDQQVEQQVDCRGQMRMHPRGHGWRWSVVAMTVLLGMIGIGATATAAEDPEDPESQIPNCGAVSAYHSLWQYAGQRRVEGIAETSRDWNGCFGTVRVEAWVEGISSSVAIAEHTYVASTNFWRTVPTDGEWTSKSKHWRISLGVWYFHGYRDAHTTVTQSSNPHDYVTNSADCAALEPEYGWNGTACVATPGSPIIIDTARDGYRLTSVEDGVAFDLDGNGTLEQIAWTREDSDDAFLALDRNGNGRIDDGTELFGNYTPAYVDRRQPRTPNGFEALRFLEGPDYGISRVDATIDARDEAFGRLLLWTDINHNGISEPEELRPVHAAGLRWIGTDYKEKRRVDRFGNEFRQKGRLQWSDGAIEPVFDIWLKWRA
jgi:hypothetical protein